LLGRYGGALAAAFREKDAGPVCRLYSSAYQSPGRGRWTLGPEQAEGDVTVSHLRAEGDEVFDKAAVSEEVKSYLASLSAVKEVKFKIDLIEAIEPGRSAVLTVKFILDGEDRAGRLVEDRHFYRWHLVNEAPAGTACDWRIVRDELVEGVRVAGTGGFEEVSPPSVGIDFKHERDPKLDPAAPEAHLRFGVIQHASGGVSAVDYNNDGRPDLFFADGKRCRL
jgi:hypothetical protein